MEDTNIRVVSFNCKGLKSSMVDVSQNLCTLHEIHDSFYGDGIIAVKTDQGILVGRPHGRLALLWRKSLNAQLQVVKCDYEDRIVGIVVKTERKVYTNWS